MPVTDGDDPGTDRGSRPSFSGDRRSSPRIAVEAELGFQSETNFFNGFSEDLSDGGLFIATYNVLPIGSELTVTFGLPEGREITAEGRVAWVREPHGDVSPGMGIRFTELGDDDHAAILRFIGERPPVFYDA
jgi:uncharacterized protein (TIGR02266 family)